MTDAPTCECCEVRPALGIVRLWDDDQIRLCGGCLDDLRAVAGGAA